MKKVECKRIWTWTLKLRCRKCGKKETFYIQDKLDVPTHGINGWYLNGTEICPLCLYMANYRKVVRGKIEENKNVKNGTRSRNSK